MAKVLAFRDIQDIDDLEVIFVEVPKWGGSVGIRSITGLERTQLEKLASNDRADPLKFRRTLLRMCLINEDKSAFLGSDADADALFRKSAAACELLVDAALRHNGIGARDAEDMEKN